MVCNQVKANGLVVLNEVTVPANEIMYHLWSVRDLEPNGKVFTNHPSIHPSWMVHQGLLVHSALVTHTTQGLHRFEPCERGLSSYNALLVWHVPLVGPHMKCEAINQLISTSKTNFCNIAEFNVKNYSKFNRSHSLGLKAMKSYSLKGFQQYQEQTPMSIKNSVLTFFDFLQQNCLIFNNSCTIYRTVPRAQQRSSWFERSQHHKQNKGCDTLALPFTLKKYLKAKEEL